MLVELRRPTEADNPLYEVVSMLHGVVYLREVDPETMDFMGDPFVVSRQTLEVKYHIVDDEILGVVDDIY